DVLERRDAVREAERAVVQWQRADIRNNGAQTRNRFLGEVDADELLRGERSQALEIGRLGERVPDVEHTPLARVARQRPRDLDRPLVRPRRREQLARPPLLQTLRERTREAVVEQLDTLELAALDELADQACARHLAALEAARRVRVRVAPKNELPCPLHEVVHEAQARLGRMPLQGKRVFITGGAGFIATTLARQLVDENEVVALDNLHRDALAATDLADHPNFQLHQTDVLDADAVRDLAHGATHIVHCAAIAGVDTVIESRVRTMRVNLIGTYNVLEAAVATQDTLERLVDFSTSEVFGTHAYNVSEGQVSTIGSVGEARWTYAVSKLAGEHMAFAYHDELRIPTGTVRPFNV